MTVYFSTLARELLKDKYLPSFCKQLYRVAAVGSAATLLAFRLCIFP